MGVEVTKDEGDQQQFDATKIYGNLDPARHYRWVRKGDVNITRKRLMGYTPVTHDSGIVHVMDDGTRLKKGEDLSTAIEMGDAILMSCPKEMYEERQSRRRAKILRQTKGVTQAYKDAIERMARAEGQGDLSFEEHRDRPMKESITETEFAREMNSMPEDETPRIGVSRRS